MESRGYFYGGFATSLNIILNGLTWGRFTWLEGRVWGGVFRNWLHRFRYRPKNFYKPKTEAELIYAIQNSTDVRFFGSGHSFNEGVVADTTLISLDEYTGVVAEDPANLRLTVKAGTRVRDLVTLLLDRGWAFEALPSHDAQSIGGILSTDVHGTGRKWGFVSGLVHELKVIDGQGVPHTVGPADDLFKAVVGGVGAAGVISEVTVQAVPRFKVEQKFEIKDWAYVKANLDNLLAANDHFSLYLFPFTGKCQVSTWNKTSKSTSFLASIREFIAISFDALLASWFGNLMAYTGLLPTLSSPTHSIKRGTNLVMESNRGFNRSIYHLHQELEFTVPYADTVKRCEEFVGLYETMYQQKHLPYALFEVRFTPAGHTRTFIGAGRDDQSTWIDLVLCDSHRFEDYYAAAEALVKQIKARPHLGKYCRDLTKADLQNVHGPHFTNFLQVVQQHDPQQKFRNALIKRLM
ncbi:MAG TPA: D-arabinono-1,4-lactone oxidase [Pyrinomonadaceae bacterium]|nr:D-arabinono-1,4-lactone oxidase [Pyrinomonadaceae bacterium]